MISLLAGLGALAAEPSHVARITAGTSFLVADGDGVPDANRLLAAVGIRVGTVGQTHLTVEPAFAFGYSEMERFSVRIGVDLEAEWVATSRTSLYGAVGLHYFRSFTASEIRRGGMPRVGVGVRLATSHHGHDRGAFIAFEPLAIERFPNGEGAQTPLRSRWGIEVTFIAAGVRL